MRTQPSTLETIYFTAFVYTGVILADVAARCKFVLLQCPREQNYLC
jgi:hypothetical protein